MTNSEVKELIKKYRSGNCTEEEKTFLHAWYLEQGSHNKITLSENDVELAVNEIWDTLPIHESSKTRILPKLWPVAATILLIVSAGLYFFRSHNNVVVTKKAEQILPGGNKALLTLADGSKIILDDAQEGQLAKEGDILISKSAEGKLIYNVGHPDSGKGKAGQLTYNTITTPNGGQYQVILPDGSRVWLNAASSLRFPTAFIAKERIVELEGEAYFEVAKNQHKPFLVKTGNQTVKVLGTHFNINAYRDEPLVRTTLLEGSVAITHASYNAILQPGQQSQINAAHNGEIKIIAANTAEAVSWKNGYFQFKNEKIEGVMRKVARWYDVEITYRRGYSEKGFTGTISRFEDVSKVLRMLELTGIVHFKIEGRRIIVMP